MTRKMRNFKNTLIQRAFQNRVKWRLSFCDIVFYSRDIPLFYYANLVTDDVIGGARTVVWHKIKNISDNKEAMLLKLGRDVAPYEIY